MEVFLIQNGRQTGPHTLAEVETLRATDNKVDRATLAWREGLDRWMPLDEVLTRTTSTVSPSSSQPIGLPALPAGLPPIPMRRPQSSASAIPSLPQRSSILPSTETWRRVIQIPAVKYTLRALAIVLLILLRLACEHH